MKKSIKQFLIYFIIGFFVTIGYKVYNTVVTVSNEIWAEFDCPYDIKEEYLDSMHYTYYRSYLVKKGFNDDTNIISNYLKRKQLESFETIKKKIPKEDALIDGLWVDYKFMPKLKNKERITTLEEFLELEGIIKNLVNKKSQSAEFQGRNKYIIVSHIAGYLARPENIVYLDRYMPHSMETLTQFICKVPDKIYESTNVDYYDVAYFLSKMSCLRIYDGRYDAMEYTPCDSTLVSQIFSTIHDIDQALNDGAYKKINSKTSDTLKYYEKLSKSYKKWLTKNCPEQVQNI